MSEVVAHYPRNVNLDGTLIELSPLSSNDLEPMVQFARALPESDRQFLRIDITDPKVVRRWIESVESGLRFTVLARHDSEIVGYGSLNRRELAWMRHLGEIRVIVAPGYRHHGLGGVLTHDIFAVAKTLGLAKLVAQMAREQLGARQLFLDLGFSAEALLTDWIVDSHGVSRDLVVMSYDVSGLGS